VLPKCCFLGFHFSSFLDPRRLFFPPLQFGPFQKPYHLDIDNTCQRLCWFRALMPFWHLPYLHAGLFLLSWCAGCPHINQDHQYQVPCTHHPIESLNILGQKVDPVLRSELTTSTSVSRNFNKSQVYILRLFSGKKIKQ